MFLLPQTSKHPLLKSTLSRKSENTVPTAYDLLNWRQVGKVKKLHTYPLTAGREKYCTKCIFNKEYMTGMLNNAAYPNHLLLAYDYERNYIISDNVMTRDVSVKYLSDTKIRVRSINRSRQLKDLIIELTNVVILSKEVNITTSFYQKFIVSVKCLDCGPEAAAWISNYLNEKNARLAFMITNSFGSLWKRNLQLNDKQADKKMNSIALAPPPIYSVMLCPLRDEFNINITRAIEKRVLKPHIYIKTNHIREIRDWNWIMIGNMILTNIKRCPRNINWENMTGQKLLRLLPLQCELILPGQIEVDDYVYIKTKMNKNR